MGIKILCVVNPQLLNGFDRFDDRQDYFNVQFEGLATVAVKPIILPRVKKCGDFVSADNPFPVG
ncbi:hypothetical protein OAG68_02490 [bacterium]|nr:hypothetical protein [bacterium]